jgi:transposase
MRPRKPFPTSAVKELRVLLDKARSEAQRQRIQAVLIRAVSDSPPGEIAKITGLTVHTVRTLHSRYLTGGVASLTGPGRGGARRRGLSPSEEQQLLSEFLERARTGGIVVVQSIQEEYEKRIGRPVNRSTVYRLLARHEWRKITPRSRHPKQNLAAQADFKKRSARS